MSSLPLWRVYVPSWGWQPLSGEGAARFGGRWNPVGMPAIYAAVELTTAWSEYNQVLTQHPGLVVRLLLTDANLADTADVATTAQYVIPSDLGSDDWRARAETPGGSPTQQAAAAMYAAGYDGLRYPSAMSLGGTCMALWRWNVVDGPGLAVEDPEARLPFSAASWRGRSG